MSLKARFRIAIVALTVGIVVVVSLLYVQDFLEISFGRTAEIAESIVGNVQAATLERLNNLPDAPADLDAAREFWVEAAERDPIIAGVLTRASANWKQISEVFITDAQGRIRASSMPENAGRLAPAAVSFERWSQRKLFTNVRQVLLATENTELVRNFGVGGKPVLSIHVVISSVFLKNDLVPRLKSISLIFLASLLGSVALGLVLPTLVLRPLERLSERIDRMTTGGESVPAVPRGESKEFAAVHSKLNLLGQQVQGARQNASALRSNVEQLIEQLQEAVLIFDTNGRLMMAGEPSRRFIGSNPENLIGQFVGDLFPPGSGMGSLLRQCLDKQEPVRDRLITLNHGGIERQVIASVEPLSRPGAAESDGGLGQPLGILVTLRDTESRGQLEEQLSVADRLTAISQLTRGVAHEIKNPLNAITVHLEVLKNRLGTDELPEVDVIAREITRLNRIVKTFLDFHRPVDLRIHRVDLNQFVCDIAKLVQPDAKSHGIDVHCEAAPAPAWIEADRDLLQQAILNVVMNALEAMPNGGELAIMCQQADGAWRVSVRDSGPGIPSEIRDKIFNLYFTTKETGSGIGLALAYRFVELMNGRLSVSSEPGESTTFMFDFPEAISETWTPTSALTQSHRA